MKIYIAFYNLFISLYFLAVKTTSFWNPKAKEWVRGRRKLFDNLQRNLSRTDRIIWVHCASAGEFEQGKPIMERLKREYPSHRILVSFFSPSGFQIAKNYAYADVVTYIPLDTPQNARRFIEITHPDLIVFIKYEFWYHHLSAAKAKQIPLILSSAVFRKDQVFFKSYGAFYRNILHFFHMIFVQNEESCALLKQYQVDHCQVGGDTRFDRVVAIASGFTEIVKIGQFAESGSLIVAGSTWGEDERLLANYVDQRPVKLILAPHEINPAHLNQLDKLFPGSRRYSAFGEGDKSRILIIDNVGMLSRLYRYATITYVGGGFTQDGIHNILEAAVYGKPVVIGPHYEKYREAEELINKGGAFTISRSEELNYILDQLFENKDLLSRSGQASESYIRENVGATEKLIRYIQENRLLTS